MGAVFTQPRIVHLVEFMSIFMADSWSSSSAALSWSAGYGVSPAGLHTGQIGRSLSIENVLTIARSTGNIPTDPLPPAI